MLENLLLMILQNVSREVLCLQTPLQRILDPSTISAHMHGMSQPDKTKHLEFILDTKATKVSDLWPESNGTIPPQNCNIAAILQASNIFL